MTDHQILPFAWYFRITNLRHPNNDPSVGLYESSIFNILECKNKLESIRIVNPNYTF